MLVVAALVLVGAHLGRVARVFASYIEHLVEVIPVHDLVAVDAPELLGISQLELARTHTIACRRGTTVRIITTTKNRRIDKVSRL